MNKQKTIQAAWFTKIITCEIGSLLAGYGPHDVSTSKYDELEANGLCLDDGERKVLIVSLDLLGINEDALKPMRMRLAKILGVPDAAVMFSCTHTHGGPCTRWTIKRDAQSIKKMPADPKYLAFLSDALAEAVTELRDRGDWRTCLVGFHSAYCDENRNRRYTTADNCNAAAEYRRKLLDVGTGIADKELGTVALLDPETLNPLYLIGNYAAHGIASHAPGKAGYRISSDYPGFFRRYLREELGCGAMFVNGAAGDVVPKENELGADGARRTGVNLAKGCIASLIDIQRNADCFVIPKPKVGALIRKMKTPLISRWKKLLGRDSVTLEVQCVSIGDVAFVGVPGETVNEIGLEIKWHSPFKRTFVAYLSTDYCGYISPTSNVGAGGYEPQDQRFVSRDTLRLVETARDALFDLRERMFPEDYKDADVYPDNLTLPLFNVPGMLKVSKWQK
ncbi:MAG: hypothetical protein PUJ80_03160 [Verrucomicrobiota bacterium]|nr:hypothetical protein [Verrucomicrobiota bacterium]MDY5597047.1 hypothetical protein [Kiritimatiellia bacterium]